MVYTFRIIRSTDSKSASSLKRMGESRCILLFVALFLAITSIVHNLRNNVFVFPSRNFHSLVTNQCFIPFHGDIEDHYSTVDGQRIPGTFPLADNGNSHLYITGVRLTTSYNNDDIHLNVFGLSGFWCRNTSHFLNMTTFQGVFLYALPVIENGLQNSSSSLSSSWVAPRCLQPFFIDKIPIKTVDSNVNRAPFIWNSNITECINRQHLKAAMSADESSQRLSQEMAFRVKLWITRQEIPMMNRTKSSLETMQPSLIVDIPLSTCVVGASGPQIRGRVPPAAKHDGNATMSEVHRVASHADTPSVTASLCVGIYGSMSVKHIPYFVQHHVNVGFEHIVIAVIWDRSILLEVQSALSTFIEQGIVVFSFMDLPGAECDSDPHKILFYQSCVYHAKGISEYVAIWDVDEFWIPPSDLPVHSLGILGGLSKSVATIQSQQETFHNDSVWNHSNYRHTFPIGLMMKALSAYHDHNGCSPLDWCTHSFPSFTIHSHRDELGRILPYSNRTVDTLFGVDYTRRDTETNLVWKKGIGKTALVHVGGFHEFGSCQLQHHVGFQNPQARQGQTEAWFDQESRFRLYQSTDVCKDLILNDFGTMHHFKDMNVVRTAVSEEEYLKLPKDEYTSLYAHTVKAQLIQSGQIVNNS